MGHMSILNSINVAKTWSWLRPRCWGRGFIPGVRSGKPLAYPYMKSKGSIVMLVVRTLQYPPGRLTNEKLLEKKKSKSVITTSKQ